MYMQSIFIAEATI